MTNATPPLVKLTLATNPRTDPDTGHVEYRTKWVNPADIVSVSDANYDEAEPFTVTIRGLRNTGYSCIGHHLDLVSAIRGEASY